MGRPIDNVTLHEHLFWTVHLSGWVAGTAEQVRERLVAAVLLTRVGDLDDMQRLIEISGGLLPLGGI